MEFNTVEILSFFGIMAIIIFIAFAVFDYVKKDENINRPEFAGDAVSGHD